MRVASLKQLTTLAAAVAAVVASTGATLAVARGANSTTPAAVTACANTKGVLHLLTPKGSCTPGFHRVSLNRRGPTGKQGPAGAKGAAGPAGAKGEAGRPGPSGRTILNGSGAPNWLTGQAGDFYLDTAGHTLYGPATRTCTPLCFTRWGSPVSLIGPAGAPGPTGPSGATGIAATSQKGANITYLSKNATTLLSFPVQAGHTYLVQSTGTIASFVTDVVTCTLDEINTKETIELAYAPVGVDQSASAFALSSVLTPGLTGTLRLSCDSAAGGSQVNEPIMTELGIST